MGGMVFQPFWAARADAVLADVGSSAAGLASQEALYRRYPI